MSEMEAATMKFNRYFYKDPYFWTGLVVIILSFDLLSGKINPIFFVIDILVLISSIWGIIRALFSLPTLTSIWKQHRQN